MLACPELSSGISFESKSAPTESITSGLAPELCESWIGVLLVAENVSQIAGSGCAIDRGGTAHVGVWITGRITRTPRFSIGPRCRNDLVTRMVPWLGFRGPGQLDEWIDQVEMRRTVPNTIQSLRSKGASIKTGSLGDIDVPKLRPATWTGITTD
jgi:hypothetical protein